MKRTKDNLLQIVMLLALSLSMFLTVGLLTPNSEAAEKRFPACFGDYCDQQVRCGTECYCDFYEGASDGVCLF